MNETSKCYQKRLAANHFERYLFGRGIDIGSGSDCLRSPHGQVRPWDVADGDATFMSGVEDSIFDFVYSSHCLEHLPNVPTALSNWMRILKPGGYLYVVVPDYLLYEKLTFPSRFNPDHKHTFSVTIPRSLIARDNHWSLEELRPVLPTIVESYVESNGFDWSKGIEDQTLGAALSQICLIVRKS